MQLPALQWVRSGITNGQSANRAYQIYRGAGKAVDARTMRKQDFLRLYSQTLGLRGQAAQAVRAPKDIPGGGLTPQVRGTTRARGFGHWVKIYQRTSGTSDLIEQTWMWKSDHVMTPEDVENAVINQLQDSEDDYNRVTLGVMFVGIEQHIPGA